MSCQKELQLWKFVMCVIKTYEKKIFNFKYDVYFCAIYENDFTDAHESHQTLNLYDFRRNLG